MRQGEARRGEAMRGEAAARRRGGDEEATMVAAWSTSIGRAGPADGEPSVPFGADGKRSVGRRGKDPTQSLPPPN